MTQWTKLGWFLNISLSPAPYTFSTPPASWVQMLLGILGLKDRWGLGGVVLPKDKLKLEPSVRAMGYTPTKAKHIFLFLLTLSPWYTHCKFNCPILRKCSVKFSFWKKSDKSSTWSSTLWIIEVLYIPLLPLLVAQTWAFFSFSFSI